MPSSQTASARISSCRARLAGCYSRSDALRCFRRVVAMRSRRRVSSCSASARFGAANVPRRPGSSSRPGSARPGRHRRAAPTSASGFAAVEDRRLAPCRPASLRPPRPRSPARRLEAGQRRNCVARRHLSRKRRQVELRQHRPSAPSSRSSPRRLGCTSPKTPIRSPPIRSSAARPGWNAL